MYVVSLLLPAYYAFDTTLFGWQILFAIPFSFFDDLVLMTLWLPNALFIVFLGLSIKSIHFFQKTGFVVGVVSVILALLSLGYGPHGWSVYEFRDKTYESAGYIFSYEFVDDMFFRSKKNIVYPEFPDTVEFAEPTSNREKYGYPLVGYYFWVISFCIFTVFAYLRLRKSDPAIAQRGPISPAQT